MPSPEIHIPIITTGGQEFIISVDSDGSTSVNRASFLEEQGVSEMVNTIGEGIYPSTTAGNEGSA